MSKKSSQPQTAPLNFLIPKDLHERLRIIAFKKNVHMAAICREGLELILKKYEKNEKMT